MNEKADYGNWVPAAMMKTLWTATAAIALADVLLFVLLKYRYRGSSVLWSHSQRFA